MKAAIYLRVSTSDQSTGLQSKDLIAYAKARGWEYIVYEDKISGTTANRPALKELLQAARQRDVDLILVWKLDRFFRSLKDLVNTLQELTDLGVGFVALKDNIDLTTASGRLMMQMLGAFAEFEAALVSERVRSGVANARRNGKRLGRPRVADLAEVKRLRKHGMSIRGIAEKLKVSRGSVESALKTR